MQLEHQSIESATLFLEDFFKDYECVFKRLDRNEVIRVLVRDTQCVGRWRRICDISKPSFSRQPRLASIASFIRDYRLGNGESIYRNRRSTGT